jgi:hypothetical protein
MRGNCTSVVCNWCTQHWRVRTRIKDMRFTFMFKLKDKPGCLSKIRSSRLKGMNSKNIVPRIFHFFTKYGGLKDLAQLLKRWLWRLKRRHSNPRKIKNKREKFPLTFQICFSRYEGTCTWWGGGGCGKYSQCPRRVNMVIMATRFRRFLSYQS